MSNTVISEIRKASSPIEASDLNPLFPDNNFLNFLAPGGDEWLTRQPDQLTPLRKEPPVMFIAVQICISMVYVLVDENISTLWKI
jgi:hypothetical protein